MRNLPKILGKESDNEDLDNEVNDKSDVISGIL